MSGRVDTLESGSQLPPDHWIKEFQVRSYEVEPDGRLRIVALTRMLQETAWQHARRLGWGLVNRREGELFWVLTRLRIRVDRYPRWGETFAIRTWPVGTEKILAIRDFTIVDDEGVAIGQVSSGYLMVDGSTGRPIRPGPFVEGVTVHPSSYDGDLSRLPAAAAQQVTSPLPVRHHDIDQYRHVNSSAYVEWIVDAIAEDAVVPEIHRLELDYVKETLLDDHFQVRYIRDGNTTLCEVVRAQGGSHDAARSGPATAADATAPSNGEADVNCRARITWKET